MQTLAGFACWQSNSNPSYDEVLEITGQQRQFSAQDEEDSNG